MFQCQSSLETSVLQQKPLTLQQLHGAGLSRNGVLWCLVFALILGGGDGGWCFVRDLLLKVFPVGLV